MNQLPTQPTLNLRDIHLPDPISWWPIAPGWWMIIASVILVIAVVFIAKNIYLKKQLNRDIKAELETIKQQYRLTKNKSSLAQSLSLLLRRASISYYPKTDIAGLIGNEWLAYLDNTSNRSSANKNFQSETGKILLSAPYLPENANLDFDAKKLIHLCEAWLYSSHKKLPQARLTREISS